jgi:hypothetical protein
MMVSMRIGQALMMIFPAGMYRAKDNMLVPGEESRPIRPEDRKEKVSSQDQQQEKSCNMLRWA